MKPTYYITTPIYYVNGAPAEEYQRVYHANGELAGISPNSRDHDTGMAPLMRSPAVYQVFAYDGSPLYEAPFMSVMGYIYEGTEKTYYPPMQYAEYPGVGKNGLAWEALYRNGIRVRIKNYYPSGVLASACYYYRTGDGFQAACGTWIYYNEYFGAS